VRNPPVEDEFLSASPSNLPPAASPAPDHAAVWKDEVSARVRAHRSGRPRIPENQPVLPGMESTTPSSVAARVAERYSRVPSWRDAMAAEAASQAAAAAAALSAAPNPARPPAKPQTAESTAAPIAQPPASLFAEPESVGSAPAPAPRRARTAAAPKSAKTEPAAFQPDLIRYSVSTDSLPAPRSAPAQARAQAFAHTTTPYASQAVLDPLADAIVEPTRLLPARVIEFPRELIAPRKARPRFAEGPLLDEAPAITEAPVSSTTQTVITHAARPTTPPDAASLHIFEAEPETSPQRATPSGTQTKSVPEWHSIHLDSEEPVREPQAAARPSLLGDTHLPVAPIEDRLMSGVVDIALTLAAFLVFVLVFAACTTHPPTGRTALIGAAVALFAMWVLYQLLFFSLSAATPGMRYAKIALCTFDDENPTRKAMRVRIAAFLLSAMPLGLGFLWTVFDEDYLGWHDRITGTYQRSYREL
jgi:uncharacterized RDD family membrane protein YckC